MVNSVISVTKMTALYLIRNLLDESSSLKTQRSPNQKLQQKKNNNKETNTIPCISKEIKIFAVK